jgi:hypothetical protein
VRYLLEDHNARLRRCLERFRGVEVETAGDGFSATFDGRPGPSDAPAPSRDSVRELGIEIGQACTRERWNARAKRSGG